MSAVGVRDMPIVEAWPAEPWPCKDWRAAFPDGERRFTDRNLVFYAAARIGASVRFLDQAPRPDQPDPAEPGGSGPAGDEAGQPEASDASAAAVVPPTAARQPVSAPAGSSPG